MSSDCVGDTGVDVGVTDRPVRSFFGGPIQGFVTLYACDNYGNDPQWLDADEARAVAIALIEAAAKADAMTPPRDDRPNRVQSAT